MPHQGDFAFDTGEDPDCAYLSCYLFAVLTAACQASPDIEVGYFLQIVAAIIHSQRRPSTHSSPDTVRDKPIYACAEGEPE